MTGVQTCALPICISPPRIPASIINTPGVTNQENVYGVAPLPVYIITDDLTEAKGPLIKGNIEEVITKNNRTKIKGLQATKALFEDMLSV